MRESFILIILPLLAIAVRSTNVERDTVNLYKDRMRSRNYMKIDPDMPDIWDPYAPLQGLEYLNTPIWISEYRKRADDAVKKRIIKGLELLGEKLKKRTSKAALSLMLQSKQDPDHDMEEEHNCFAGK